MSIFWKKCDTVHNNKQKNDSESKDMLNNSKNNVNSTQKEPNIDTLILEANAISFMIERFN
jgi:hypothetical protein